MKKKLCRVFTILIALSIVIAFYFVFVRSWRSSLDAESEINIMRNVSYFNNKSQIECKTTLSAIYSQCSDTISFDENQEVNNNGFERWSDLNLEDGTPVLTLGYYFKTRTKNEKNDPENIYAEYEDTYIYVYIYAGSDFSYNLLHGPSINTPYNKGASPPYLIEDFDKEFGKFRPIFNLMSKHGKKSGFEYYASPLISTKDDMGWPTNYGGIVGMVFVCNGYTIYIHESANSDYNYRYKDVIADLDEVFKQTESAESQ